MDQPGKTTLRIAVREDAAVLDLCLLPLMSKQAKRCQSQTATADESYE